jgi:hypothetical protein
VGVDQPGPPALIPGGRPTSGLAIAALVVGVLGVTVAPIGAGLLAAPLGAAGLAATRGGRREGRGMALAGFLLGLVTGVVPTVALLALWEGLHRGWAWAAAGYGLACAAVGLVALASGGPDGRRLFGVAIGAGLAGTAALAVGVAVIVGLAVALTYGAVWLIAEIIRQATSG